MWINDQTKVSVPLVSPNLRSELPSGYRSPYYGWFVDMGYPNLDIMVEGRSWWKDCEESGIWHIIEFYRSPVIPAMTPWNYVLRDIRNVEISFSFVQKHVHRLDLRRKFVWEEEDAKSKAVDAEQEMLAKHKEETAERALHIIKKNPYLMDRIFRNGPQELEPWRHWQHVPRHQRIGSRINKGFLK